MGPCPRTHVILATDIWLGLMVDLVPSLRSSASSCHRRAELGDRRLPGRRGLGAPRGAAPCAPWPCRRELPTSFSVTNSASSPTRSPACGISLSMRGMKVAWHLRCLRAREASASSTLASMGFLTAGRGGGGCGVGGREPPARAPPAPRPLPARALTDEVVLGVEVPPGVVEDGRYLPAHVELHCLTLQGVAGGRCGAGPAWGRALPPPRPPSTGSPAATTGSRGGGRRRSPCPRAR